MAEFPRTKQVQETGEDEINRLKQTINNLQKENSELKAEIERLKIKERNQELKQESQRSRVFITQDTNGKENPHRDQLLSNLKLLTEENSYLRAELDKANSQLRAEREKARERERVAHEEKFKKIKEEKKSKRASVEEVELPKEHDTNSVKEIIRVNYEKGLWSRQCELKVNKYCKDESQKKCSRTLVEESIERSYEKQQWSRQSLQNVNEYREYLYETGQLCAMNCFLCCIVWICHNKLHIYLCGLQLLILIFPEVVGKIDSNLLRCEHLIVEIFLKKEIVNVIFDESRGNDENENENKIHDIWEKISTTLAEQKAIIFSLTKQRESIGHAEVFDLESRHGSQQIMKYDLQARKSEPVTFQTFFDTAKDFNRLLLFTVDLDNLEIFIKQFGTLIHKTDKPNEAVTPQIQSCSSCMSLYRTPPSM